MFIYPHINPIALSIGPVHVHWYGLMYLIGFVSAWFLANMRVKLCKLKWSTEQISDLIFYAALGVILGGRIGYMLFYNTHELIHHPLSLFKIWQGGMSFHGGLLGVLFAIGWFAHKIKKSFWEVADFVAPLVPIGLACGRVGNFINGELWGRVTNVPWGMIFPFVDKQPRHPSQLYEVGLEGIVLFIIVWWYARKPRPLGCVAAIFLIYYSISRLIIECFRQPDAQLGFLAFHWLTMGQLLSIPMLCFGLFIWWTKRHEQLSTIN